MEINNILENRDMDVLSINKIETEIETEIKTEIKTKNDLHMDSTFTRVFRFKFNDDFVKDLYTFSKVHQYDDRDTFKEAWKIWVQENELIVDKEIERLSRLGYEGDIKDKMFKSARYYFRKKTDTKKEPVKRREYINVSKELLDKMDLHISEHIQNAKYTPKDGFILFCDQYTELLKEGISKICQDGVTDATEICNKMKKTYKNRYFMLTKK